MRSRPRVRFRHVVVVLFALTTIFGRSVHAQVNPPPPLVGGVYVDTDGTVRVREADAKSELARVRAKMRGVGANAKEKDEKLAFVSLPKLFAQVREHRAAGREVPPELRYLGGITRLRYVLLDPETRDLVIAGPAEPIDAANPLQPVGTLTGRPVLQADDLVVALRALGEGNGANRAFGCSIDPQPNAMEKAQEVMRRNANRPRRELMAAMAEALGPQVVRTFGPAGDTRLSYVCVAADYRLKRFVLGIEPPPVPGVGHAVDNSRAAGNLFWFETMYEPLLVAQDGNAYEIRGQRLQLKTGAFVFDERGATEKAKAFAKQFTAKIPDLAMVVPVFADLQNVADLSLLANLMRKDKLPERVGWDLSPILDPAAHPVETVPVPRTAETLVNITSGSLTAGGVSLRFGDVVGEGNRKRDSDRLTDEARRRHAQLKERAETKHGAVWSERMTDGR